MDLLTQLNAGDMVAQEAKYHRNCLLNLYNRARKMEMAGKGTNDEHAIAGLAFAELVVFIEEAHMGRLRSSNLLTWRSYTCQGWNKHEGRVHTTRLKQRLLAHFPNMCSQHQGRDVLLAFNEDLGDALAKA